MLKKSVSRLTFALCLAGMAVGTSFPVAAQDAAALLQQGEALLWGIDQPANPEAAAPLLLQAAQMGDLKAMRVLGEQLLGGWTLPADPKAGRALLEQAIAGGDVEALTALGQAHLWGTGLPKDPAKARSLLEQAANRGDVKAMRILGEQLIGGWGLDRQLATGQALLEKAIAAGDDKANVALGGLLLYGIGLPRDRARALALFEAAAEAGNGAGLAKYGEEMMWAERDAKAAEEMLLRAADLGATEAWVTLANGAMYGYLGGGRISRAKFEGYAEKAREAAQDRIEVLDATRTMWGINTRASGPGTIAHLTRAAEAGNADAARFLVQLLRDGNRMNLFRRPDDARTALGDFGHLLPPDQVAQLSMTIDASRARTPQAYAPVAKAYASHPELKSTWFGKEMYKANPNVAFYILQQNLRDEGLYAGRLNGYATRATLRAVYRACRANYDTAACDDTVMRADVIGALLAR